MILRRLCFLRPNVFCSLKLISNLDVRYANVESSPVLLARQLHNEAETNKLDERQKLFNFEGQLNLLWKSQMKILSDFVENSIQPNDEEWSKLVENILKSKNPMLNEKIIYVKIMEFCYKFQNLDLAKNLLHYMKRRGLKLNLSILAIFLNICYVKGDTLSEEEYKHVQYFTNYLHSKSNVMDAKLGTAVIKGLALLQEWEKCDEFIKHLENIKVLPISAYSVLTQCLIRCEKLELAEEKLEEGLKKQQTIKNEVYYDWIKKNSNNAIRLQRLLSCFQRYEVIPTKSVCYVLVEAFSKLPPEERLEGKFTKINRDGSCRCCHEQLDSYVLTTQQFDKLRETFLNQVMVSSDVFINTTPRELKAFFKCVQLHAPFDVVVDGLNVMYGLTTDRTKIELANTLKDVVDYFYKNNKKILLIGKKHMNNLPRKIMQSIREKSILFLVDDLSEDDLFIIYASLYSGMNCFYVTKDLLRSEKCRLKDDSMTDLFKKWQLTHQIRPVKRFVLKPPFKFKICVQNNGSFGWHIPYHEDSYTGYDNFEELNWLCLHK